jgi:hypothetical protein
MARGDGALVGDDEQRVLARRKQLGPRVGAPFDLISSEIGLAMHIRPKPWLRSSRQGHVEHHALVVLARQHLDLALAAGAGAAVVGQRVAGLLQRHEHGVAGGNLDGFARGLDGDAGHGVRTPG